MGQMGDTERKSLSALAALAVFAFLLVPSLGGCAARAVVGTAAAVTGVAAKTTVKAGAAVVRTTGRAAGAAVRTVTN
jgi:hypothetical protein